ncbi:MAG: glycine dehydrogenase, partial [Dehalococcoidia bacterium]|nr:glycine dehydrogenase [Dehalococcoidia bacterium]
CTNEALYALASTIYLAALGKQGLRHVAELCYHKAHYAAGQIARLPGYSLPIEGAFFREFVVQCPVSPAVVNNKLLERNILGGLDLTGLTSAPPSQRGERGRLTNPMLLCVTEMNSREDIDALVAALEEIA